MLLRERVELAVGIGQQVYIGTFAGKNVARNQPAIVGEVGRRRYLHDFAVQAQQRVVGWALGRGGQADEDGAGESVSRAGLQRVGVGFVDDDDVGARFSGPAAQAAENGAGGKQRNIGHLGRKHRKRRGDQQHRFGDLADGGVGVGQQVGPRHDVEGFAAVARDEAGDFDGHAGFAGAGWGGEHDAAGLAGEELAAQGVEDAVDARDLVRARRPGWYVVGRGELHWDVLVLEDEWVSY